MMELGWYVRQIRTQTIWLTATLPPAMEEEFVQLNKLVRPAIIRESTNRPNIQYLVDTAEGDIFDRAATHVIDSWSKGLDRSNGKVIIYC
ncbi:hypothetical protein GMDG_08536 [Pseudogymnoascus destructans 20631-21]|uniref:Helicase ATP-binding domain-containing protein n=1 Tax=Pseudogymnoascus destructans (strain ATCC MYA-4855 / 20631-21) TaxID=658429 RepID=L8G4K0_PSED2|nr:hypothetical protein GMDG_08536 [Pseudogymnoascus destructans 20631-21]